MTTAGMVVGTYSYMAPEQLLGEVAGPASDVFGLGCTLAFAATARVTFGDDSIVTVVYRITKEPPDLTGVTEEHGFRQLLSECLAKNPADRPGLATILKRLTETGSAARAYLAQSAMRLPLPGRTRRRRAGPEHADSERVGPEHAEASPGSSRRVNLRSGGIPVRGPDGARFRTRRRASLARPAVRADPDHADRRPDGSWPRLRPAAHRPGRDRQRSAAGLADRSGGPARRSGAALGPRGAQDGAHRRSRRRGGDRRARGCPAQQREPEGVSSHDPSVLGPGDRPSVGPQRKPAVRHRGAQRARRSGCTIRAVRTSSVTCSARIRCSRPATAQAPPTCGT